MIELGDKVRDRISGAVGITVYRTEWANGCIRWGIQPPVDKDGKVPDMVSVDEQDVEVVQKQVAPPVRVQPAPVAQAQEERKPLRRVGGGGRQDPRSPTR